MEIKTLWKLRRIFNWRSESALGGEGRILLGDNKGRGAVMLWPIIFQW